MIRPSLYVPVLFLLLLAGCSSKEYYKPEKTVNSWPVCKEARYSAEAIVGEMPAEDDIPKWPVCKESGLTLAAKGAEGAVSQEGRVVDADGIAGFKIPANQRYLGQSGGWVLSTGIDGNVTLRRSEGNETIVMPLEKTVAAAAVKDDFLAVLFANDDMGLYRLSTKKSYFKTQGTPPTAVDVRIVSPYFLGSLVVFPTLDGRFVVVDYKNKEVLRSMVVSSEPYFDNIFYFNVIGDAMVAATQQRLFSLTDKDRREKYDLRDVVFDRDGIWIATKEGEVIHLTSSLQTIAKQKFPFAHFLGMIVGKEKVYLLEKEGYLIVMDKAMTQTEVYNVELDEGISYTAKNAFYVSDKMIIVE
jgi:hypothetical protein